MAISFQSTSCFFALNCSVTSCVYCVYFRQQVAINVVDHLLERLQVSNFTLYCNVTLLLVDLRVIVEI